MEDFYNDEVLMKEFEAHSLPLETIDNLEQKLYQGVDDGYKMQGQPTYQLH